MSDILSHWWVNLGHKVMPDTQPYICPMVLQPVPPCPNERLSSDSDGEPDTSARPKTQRPLKGILKKPKMTDSRSESNSPIPCNENSVPVKSHSDSDSVFNSATKEETGSHTACESADQSGAQSSETSLDFNKKIFDAQRMPARSILKRKGKYSSGDSGCELNDSKSKTSSISSYSMDLSDSMIDSPDYLSAISSKDCRKGSGSLNPGAFDFIIQQESSLKSTCSSNSDVVDGLNIVVVPRRRGILKNRSQSKEDADKRLSTCSIGSNSSADILDFSYDSCEDLLSPHYYRQQSPRSSAEYEQDSSADRQEQKYDDSITYEDAKQVYTKALEICKNL